MNTEQDKRQTADSDLEALEAASRPPMENNTSVLQTVGPSVAQTQEQLDSLGVFQKLVEEQFKSSSCLTITKALESDPVILEAATGLGIPHNQMVINTTKGLSFIVLQNALDMFIQSHSTAIGVKFLLNNQYQYKKRGIASDKTNSATATGDTNSSSAFTGNGHPQNQDHGYGSGLTGAPTAEPTTPVASSALTGVPAVDTQAQQQTQQQQDTQEQTGTSSKVRYRYRCHRASTKSIHKGRVPGGKSGKTRCVKASIKCGCEATIAAVSDFFHVYGENNQRVDSVPIYRIVYKAGHNHSLNMADPSAPVP